MKEIPISPFPSRLTTAMSNKFIAIGDILNKSFPNLQQELVQANISVNARRYLAVAVLSSVFYGILILLLILVISLIFRDIPIFLFILAPVFSVFLIFATITYPKTIIRKRMRKLDAQLIPALQHILIQIRSGVPLFNAITAVSSDYGGLSEEFKKVIKAVNAGEDQTDSLNKATERNPSFNFRRAMWQINNAIKAGSDVGDALEAILEDFRQERVSLIRKYGQQLNPWTMIYMIAAVIIPSLGITFLVIITSFSGAAIPKLIFPVILVALFAFEIFFMSFVRSRRPIV